MKNRGISLVLGAVAHIRSGNALAAFVPIASVLLAIAAAVSSEAAAASPSTGATGAVMSEAPRGALLLIAGVPPEGMGGGEFPLPTDEISEAERAEIQENLRASIERLRGEGRLIESPAEAVTAAAVLFGWPVRIAPGLGDPGHHGISNFVDEDPAFPDLLLDYNCGTRTYDLSSGYNHAGTDIFTWPWAWLKMDRNEVQVVAGAAGQIISRADGNFDRNCGFGGGAWNAVYVRHADGSIAWYGHLKSGSLTPKLVGDTVAQGEYLGVVGSSGNSTAPHLHFEVYDAGNNLIDPWQGACNAQNPDSWWASQRPYYDSAINRVTTGGEAPFFTACPTQETPNASINFVPGSTVYFTTYYRDQLSSQSSTYTIYRPNGTIYAQWTHNSNAAHYAAAYWYWWLTINDAQGVWRFTVNFQSRTIERYFTMGIQQASGRVPERTVQGTLLRADRSGTRVHLTWGGSCVATDTNYVVYEGALGSFATHLPVLCGTAGLADATFAPLAGNRYFLVGPRNASFEGSLGTASNGSQRPTGSAQCVARLTLDCP